MFCDKCGKQVDDGQTFCPNCGNQLNGQAPAQQAAQPAAPAAPAAPTSNPVAIVGFIFSFFGGIVGFVCSIIGLVLANKGAPHKGLAIAGIVISCFWILIFIILIASGTFAAASMLSVTACVGI